ncbi:MAG TPA: type II toxin-antitoxin system VapC family toxin [Rhodopseudomonas sp.]|uniref:PIN domain-containing protein n=1 Tax=Rhodopseudomonas sp. TaxID=1078 RepID=UPI002ED8CE87
MIGVDTNVLLRFFDSVDQPQQATAVRELVRSQGPVFVNPIVLVEFVWTLRRKFQLDRDAIYARLSRVTNSPEFAIAEASATGRAVESFRNGPADFADYLMGELNKLAGCETTVTFDKDAAKHPTFALLET